MIGGILLETVLLNAHLDRPVLVSPGELLSLSQPGGSRSNSRR